MATTFINDRWQKARRKRDLVIADITHRACKRSGIILDAVSPAAVISALEKYIEDLRDIEADLLERLHAWFRSQRAGIMKRCSTK